MKEKLGTKSMPDDCVEFVHLHNHTVASLLDGYSKIKDLVKRAKKLGMKALAITDHGVAYGLVDFYTQCKKEGIKPILGCEFYVANGSRFDKSKKIGEERYYHLIILVKNKTGYKNLCKLVTRSNTEGFYYKPRIDFELLKECHEGLVCLSACVAGEVPRAILRNNGDISEAKEIALRYKELFGDDYYLEVQNHGLAEERIVTAGILRLSHEVGIKVVATNDTHYVNPEDAEAHEWLLCLQTDKKIDDPDRMIYEGDYSLKSGEEMAKLFPGIPEVLSNTLEVAEKCNFDFEFGDYRMPKVVIPESYGNDYFKYLSDESWKGLDKRYPEGHSEREQAIADLNYELKIVKQMGFAEYFLDTRKTIMWAKAHGILVGPGRGSGAGSRMCYCLGITDVDPIRYNLLFERFLNPERISMPDIDVDYDYSHKDEIVASEAESNGIDHFAKIQTFNPMLAKGVVRDCARIGGYPASVGATLAGFIPEKDGEGKKITLSEAWKMNPDLRNFVLSDPGYKKIWDMALKLEGTSKSAGTHACGHIPTPVPCEELFPCSVDENGYLVCQYTFAEAEHLGNLKKDLLMLRNLTIIDVAMSLVKERYGISLPLWNDDILNDKEALELIASGDTNGVFQLESEGMKGFMKALKPSCFEDIVAGVALYRPGPMDFIPKYIEGKHNPSSISYMVPALKEILEPTYGVIIFQEQVMRICQVLAGFTLGRADVVRKAMGKKKMSIMEEERTHFIYGYHEEGYNIPGCIANGISKEVAETIYDQMIDFAKYAFNKSHAAAYAAISMQTAYLKAHYPLEFAAGLLSSVMDNLKKLPVYISEYKQSGMTIMPPNVNTSGISFKPVGGELCYGLASIKNAGMDVISGIISERETHGQFKSYTDFVKRCYTFGRKSIEALIKAGALDFTGLTRRTMIEDLSWLIDSIKAEKKRTIAGQMSLFEFMGTEEVLNDDSNLTKYDEYPVTEKLMFEKEATGFFFTGHPIDPYMNTLRSRYNVISNQMLLYDEENGRYNIKNGSEVFIAGIVTESKIVYTKKDGRQMSLVTLEDNTSSVKAVFFPDCYDKCGRVAEENALICIKGHVKIDDKGLSVIADYAFNVEKRPADVCVRVQSLAHYRMSQDNLEIIIGSHPGGVSSIYCFFNDTKSKIRLTTGLHETLITEDMLRELTLLFGKENVQVF